MHTRQKPKVAIVHDWLVGGGAERVVLALHEMYPEAPIYTSYCSEEWRKKLDNKVITGYLQRWPFSRLRKFLAVLRIWWFTHLDFSGYDLVITSSGNGEAFGVKTPKNTLHVNYCHSPTHYYWRDYDLYIKNPGFGIFNPVARLGLKLLVGPLRYWDYKAAQRADAVIANSTQIQADIKKYYGREATVIHPPVDIERFKKGTTSKRRGFITAGRQVPQKRHDVAIRACSELNLPLTVIGTGPEHRRLQANAGPTITFTGFVPDKELPRYFANAEAFLFTNLDDFGIVPVEAMAAGTPVIAYRGGGALDYVVEGKTGVFFDEQNPASIEKALKKFSTISFDHAAIKKAAQAFSVAAFKTHFQQFITKLG